MSTPNTDLLDPEKMREAIAEIRRKNVVSPHSGLGVRALEQQASFAINRIEAELHDLNRRLLAAKVARWNTRARDEFDVAAVRDVAESERLLHEAFESLEAKRDAEA